jgi:hypothetical protein
MANQTIAEKVQRISNAIQGALSNQEILAYLIPCGYTPERITEGLHLLEHVNQLTTLHAKEYGEKITATTWSTKSFAECISRYMVILKLVRVAFKNETGVLVALKASGRRHHSYSGWLSDAHTLYGNLLSSETLLAQIATLGVTRERLEQESQQVNEFEVEYRTHLKETGEAQQTTIDRDAAIDKLSDWFSDFRAVARIALYERPQLLEALGIVVKR